MLPITSSLTNIPALSKGKTSTLKAYVLPMKNYLNLTPVPINVADVKAEGLAALIVDVRKNFYKPLSQELLFNWHKMVFPGAKDSILHPDITIGRWRNSPEPIQIISGPIGYEIYRAHQS
jgi:hypothetical protein